MRYIRIYLSFLMMFAVDQVTISQINFYQDIFQGGVTGDGYNPWYFGGPGNIIVDIEPGSTIRKAFLFYSIVQPNNIPFVDKQSTILLNTSPIVLTTENVLSGYTYNLGWASERYVQLYVADVTSVCDPSVNIYTLTPPLAVDPTEEVFFAEYYLLVLYDSPSLNKISINVYLNNKDGAPLLSYELNSFNPMDTLQDIGLILHASNMCDTIQDGSYVEINSNQIGLIGGQEDNTIISCAGVTGSFYYKNSALYGLSNDVTNQTMSGLDAIANISPYLVNDTVFDLDFIYQSNFGPNSNTINQLFLAYTTPCDTFSVSVTNDTTLCYGQTLQLNASGGQSYEWLPSIGLSCSDCPNPIFTGDSSMFFTVRIWNNDSCSVVRPLKINVNRTTIDSLSLTAPDCGASNGSIAVYAHNTLNDTLFFSLNGTSTGSATMDGSVTFNGLGEGSYTLSVQDAMGCPVIDSTIFLSAVNTTVSQFALNPTVGNVPLEMDAYNLCQNATDYAWYINGAYAGDDFAGFTIEDGGEYLFELVAWQYDPSCADTFSLIVLASEVIIPTAFTPDGDGDNDMWELVNLDAHYPKNIVKVFNRWGSLLFQSNAGKYNQQAWDGTYNGQPLPVGSYYFIIETHTEGVDDFNGTVTVVRNK